MPWNWELPDWPHFRFDPASLVQKERLFLLRAGQILGAFNELTGPEQRDFAADLLTSEGQESALIEGEVLNRESLRSSIQRHFGLKSPQNKKGGVKEESMAELLVCVHETFAQPLTHEMLWLYHRTLFAHTSHLENLGAYRTHEEPMQIVSSRYGPTKVFFEAPPSSAVFQQMDAFIRWFNAPSDPPSVLARAAIAHLYFESIHPFEDGNGRIGRVLVEKALSQGVGHPVLLAISKVLERDKKNYYSALATCNTTLDIQSWVDFFKDAILQAQDEALTLLHFIAEKSKLLSRLHKQLNPRQEKVLLHMFAEGPSGFKGGLSADNYIAITHASRATATRDLADLVAKGALIKTGELRHTRYWLKLPHLPKKPTD